MDSGLPTASRICQSFWTQWRNCFFLKAWGLSQHLRDGLFEGTVTALVMASAGKEVHAVVGDVTATLIPVA